MSKTVAAIIPNYNYADFIEERIDSVVKQTYPISELVILDDASQDNSVEIIRSKIKQIKQNYPKIKIKMIVNKENSGGLVFSQWQKGVQEIKSDYFWIAEADDAADKRFLETAMKKFEEYPSAVLFFSDSYRINGNGRVTSKTCQDWADIWECGRWSKDYFNRGEDEVINYFAANNIILNVSSVVWKNQKKLLKIFEEAKRFKVAGDWYIYTRILEDGDIVYSAKPLNRYRKHDQGSASTVVNLSREYGEVVKIQERVAKKYNLSGENLKWQIVRRKYMGMVENKHNVDSRGKIAWFVPDFPKGAGGHRTIFQNINKLVEHGYKCDLYVDVGGLKTPALLYKNICEWYGDFKGDVFNSLELAGDYDMVVATSWDTAKSVDRAKSKRKLYFIQDFEPWFFAMGQNYLKANESYKYGFSNVSIGNWLPAKLKKEHNLRVASFSFGADLSVYKRKKNIKKENAICFIFQPFKPRRCAEMGLDALKIVQMKRPDLKVYLYGSKKVNVKDKNVEHLGMLDVEKCNDLYNRCKVGLCISSSNPSRIPFEMMAAGLPVVDLHVENNLYDFPEDGCLLAEPRPEAIAAAILKILDDDKLREKMSKAGEKYMKDFPLERGFDEFVANVDKIMSDKTMNYKKNVKTYSRPSIKPMKFDFKGFKGFDIDAGEPRVQLTIPRRVYLKLRYIILGR